MDHRIEIYVRQSNQRTMLNFYVPAEMREAFIDGIRAGAFVGDRAAINLELSVQPEWVTDEKGRKDCALMPEPLHVRIPVACINSIFDD